MIIKQKIKTILIANRGEIACRIIKTAKKLGIKTLVLYTLVDKNSLFVEYADVSIQVNDIKPNDLYLNIDKIVEIAKLYNVDAIHTGYGFLSENLEFIERLEKEKIRFIGPSSSSVKMICDKMKAKQIAKKLGINYVKTCDKLIINTEQAIREAHKIGYPVLLKATNGGGGHGIKIVYNDQQIKTQLENVKYEAKVLFKNDDVLMEKYIENPRHIEVQIVADKYGNIVCLGERECSIQRKNQKIIEEAPSVFIDDEIRKQMYNVSIKMIKECKYYSVGTLEFIVDSKRQFYFMEMNTRLQVEHGITEYITGLDLVELMIKIEQGEKLPFSQKDIKIQGHSVECRICAERPSHNFAPSLGKILHYIEPEKNNNVRIDTGIQLGDEITPYFDSMIAKLIVYGNTRIDAIELMKQKLSEYEIDGIDTNISFLENIIRQQDFILGDLSTNFIKNHYPDGFNNQNIDNELTKNFICSSIILYLLNQKEHFELVNDDISYITRDTSFSKLYIILNDKSYFIEIESFNENMLSISYNKQTISVGYNYFSKKLQITDIISNKSFFIKIRQFQETRMILQSSGIEMCCEVYTQEIYEYIIYMPKINANDTKPQFLLSPITGIISKIKVNINEMVDVDNVLLTIDAMKMTNNILAQHKAKIKNIFIKVGDKVKDGDKLIEFDYHY